MTYCDSHESYSCAPLHPVEAVQVRANPLLRVIAERKARAEQVSQPELPDVDAVLAGSRRWAVVLGDSAVTLRYLPAASVDAVVTDPPAGISFMGKEWDDDKGGRDAWIAWLQGIMEECLRVLKPGGHALVWAIPRTSHWTATAIEDAGFEIRDVVTHHFGTGFPKSHDVSKAIDKAAGVEREVIGRGRSGTNAGMQDIGPSGIKGGDFDVTAPATATARRWSGWGTALKPASEHWILARKPLDGTVERNVRTYGTGALNIDGCRIGTGEKLVRPAILRTDNQILGKGLGAGVQEEPPGRWPANLVLSHSDECADECASGCPVAELDGQSGMLTSGRLSPGHKAGNNFGVGNADKKPRDIARQYGNDSGGASRFFYVAKPSKSEKEAAGQNHHPTVKSIALMRWLCRLITPPGGIVLDPFAGSGSTGCAALGEGFRFVGCEREAEYHAIAVARLQHAEGSQ